MNFPDLKELITNFYPEVLDEPGEVFFGSTSSLTNSNGIAIIGLNPGGRGLPTVRDNLTQYESHENSSRYSGYLDQCWHEPYYSRYKKCPRCIESLSKTGTVHQDRHQKMISIIAQTIEINLRETISMNAIWIQTKTAAQLREHLAKNKKKNMKNLFKDNAYPIFCKIFSSCNIQLVICLGNGATESSFEFFRTSTNTPKKSLTHVSNNYRDGRYFESTINKQRILFFGVPHPSRHTTSQLGMDTLKQKWKEFSHPKLA